ncbi:MAG: hypothetical protein RR342_01465 [Bacilli bacterium]
MSSKKKSVELTDTQKFMIEQIKKTIVETKSNWKHASDSEKPFYRMKIANLEKQLENASKPFKRTKKEEEIINQMAKKIKNNAEVENGTKIEGDRADKKLTSAEDFKYKLGTYINNNIAKIVELEKGIAVQEEVLITLKAHTPASEEPMYAENIRQIEENIVKLKIAVTSMKERVEEKEFVDEIIKNYEFVSRMNRFLGNPLGLADYEEYSNSLKSKVIGGDK